MPALARCQSPAAEPDAATQQPQSPQPQQSTQQRRFLPGMTKDHQGTFAASRQEKTEGRPHSTKKAEGCQQTQYHIPYHTAPPFPNLCPGRAVCSFNSVQYFYGLEKGFDKKVSKNSHAKAPPLQAGLRKTVNGAYQYRYAPFLIAMHPVVSALGSPFGRAVTAGD